MNDDEYDDYDRDYDEQIDKLNAAYQALNVAEETIWKLENRIFEMKANMELLLIENSTLRKQLNDSI